MRALLVVSALAALLQAAPARAELPFRVIVHPASSVASLPRAELSRLFLKKVTRWPDGTLVRPVELPAGARAREAFCEAVHGKSAAAVKSYWNQLIFAGREVPPVEKGSDEDVVAFVRSTAGAIGVVSAAASTSGVKLVELK